jgi:acetyltransferase-like isoleucine patch superfamily enzyme
MKLKRKVYYFIFLLIKLYDNPLATKFRKFLIQGFLNCKVNNLYVRSGVCIFGYRNLKIGNDVSINHGCFLSCDGGLAIGDFVSIGHNTSILTTEHTYNVLQVPIKYQPIKYNSVLIKDNVWIGANVTILSGVHVAEGTVIAAGAVVTKSIVEKNTIVGGVPAKFIKGRYDD